jgi:SAM-dependent methyltransferase
MPKHRIIHVGESVPRKKEWTEIARAYQEVIVPNPAYQELASAVTAEVKGKKIVDLGCGTGFQLKLLLDQDFSREVVGVDSGIEMLDIALEELVKYHNDKDFRLYHGDATVFNAEKYFDAAISTNVLFNLEKPMDYFDNAYSLLSPGGILVISSPFEIADIEARKREMEQHFKREGTYKQKRKFIETVWEVNRRFPASKPNLYSHERMKKILLNFIGFDKILAEHTVYFHNFLIAAQKETESKQIRFEITNSPERLEQGFKLRYHWLHERYGVIQENPDCTYRDEYDRDNIGCFAIEEGTDKIIGFVNYISPGKELPFVHRSLADVKRKYPRVGAFNGYYVVRTKQRKGIGTFIQVLLMHWLSEQGIDAAVAEANPNIVRLIEKTGGEFLGKAFDTTRGKPRRSLPVLYDLTSKKTQNIIQKEIRIYEEIYGKPSIKIKVY